MEHQKQKKNWIISEILMKNALIEFNEIILENQIKKIEKTEKPEEFNFYKKIIIFPCLCQIINLLKK